MATVSLSQVIGGGEWGWTRGPGWGLDKKNRFSNPGLLAWRLGKCVWVSVCLFKHMCMCTCVYAASRDKERQRDCFLGNFCRLPNIFNPFVPTDMRKVLKRRKALVKGQKKSCKAFFYCLLIWLPLGSEPLFSSKHLLKGSPEETARVKPPT